MERREHIEAVQSSDKNEARRASLSKKLFAAGAGIALAGSLAACGSEANEAPEPGTKPVAEAPEAPGEAPVAPAETAAPAPTDVNEIPTPAELIDVEAIPTSWVEQGTYEYLTPEAKAEVDRLNNMSVEEFRTLPVEQQLSFSMFVLENAIPSMDYLLEYNDVNLKYVRDSSDPQQLSDNNLYVMMTGTHMIYENESGTLAYDDVLARKLGSLNVTGADAAKWDAIIDQVSVDNQWAYKPLYDQERCTVTRSETFGNGDMLTYDCSSQVQDIYGVTLHKTPYTSFVDGQQYTVFADQTDASIF